LGLKLRQNLGEQLTLMLDEDTTAQSLVSLQNEFQALLTQGLEQGGERTGFSKAASHYQAFLQAYRKVRPRAQPGYRATPGGGIQPVAQRPARLTQQALQHITRSEETSRDRALLISGLLGLMGLAVLVLGFITAHNIARRFGQPIEALAKAADQLGKAIST
jgi:NtrC-family two-component system sensor histidine kinase KinB